jgi:hypothetical protein
MTCPDSRIFSINSRIRASPPPSFHDCLPGKAIRFYKDWEFNHKIRYGNENFIEIQVLGGA